MRKQTNKANKPFTLMLEDTGNQLAEILNKSNLPVFCLKKILEDLYAQLERIDQEEIIKYQESQKESDK